MRTYQPHINIRLDALLIWALLAALTPVGVLLMFLHRRPPRP
ncbi:hypothetical protein [Nonomuraea rubra]